ncbi:MAG TPA: SusC/RagA family TonB-linked outer membrane protein [Gemmatimonadaceae bacterium]|nr:SusC/RagA family TonB-linked outer membrane protein [Gemmatimonadaceae bacterium]
MTLALLVVSAAAAQAQQGSIAVTVTETASGQPIDQAQVTVVNTTLGGLTNAEGKFTLRGVPVGSHRVRVLRVGFGEQSQTVNVTEGATAEVTIQLSTVAVSLAPVVTTATGETRRVEIGNAITNIDASQVTETSAISTVNDVLNSRAPGVIVTTGTQTGVGSRIRIRGQNSLSLSNDPIWVIDGVRMTSDVESSNLFTGGGQPSRVNDINPDDIESIEVVKGPSAATLYGTDAANGVIVVTTKRGRAGEARWNVWGEGGILQDRNTYPYHYTLFGRAPGDTDPGTLNPSSCNVFRLSRGECVEDSLAVQNLFEDPEQTPLGQGWRSQLGANVSGGTEVVRYFVSAENEKEIGTMELPAFEKLRFDTLNIPIRPWVKHPNATDRTSLRANLNATINSKLDVGVTSMYANTDARFSLESNATAGLGSQAFGGPGCKFCDEPRLVGRGLGTPLYGYRAWTPGYSWQEKAGQRVDRFIGSINANYRPTSWWSNRLNVGQDITDRVDDNLLFRGEGPPINSSYRDGFKQNDRANIKNLTVDLASTASYNPLAALNLKTTVGIQYVDRSFERNTAGGSDLPPGTQTAGAAAVQYSGESTVLQKTLGFFVEEAAAINDRLFLTAAVRSDQNSAFGTDFQRVYYPKFSVSWLTSEESFFPAMSWLNSLRLRAAYGASGVQPGPNDALRFFAATTANVRGVDEPAVVFSSIGNQNLKPERSTEFEAGFEAKLFADRASLDVTYYRKKTKDALIDAIVPPSAGSATDRRQNLGSVQNQGWEALISTQVIDRSYLGLDLSLNLSTNKNKLISLGDTPPQIGTTTRVVEGYPLFGFWAQPINGWEDKNGDGIITYNDDESLNELFVGDDVVFRGYTQPRYTATLSTGLDLLDRRLRLTTLWDYRGGHLHYNNTERIRCTSRQNCNGLMNPNASFEEQAMVAATREHPSRTLDGFFQDGDFLKLREVTAAFSLPNNWASMMKARSAQLVFTARQLAVWTDYRGVDPETEFNGTASDAPSEFQTLGPPSYFILRVNLGF